MEGTVGRLRKKMKTKNWAILVLVNLGTGVLTISPFLPGPSNRLVHFLFSSAQLLAVPAIVVFPIGLLWTIKELRRKRSERDYQTFLKPLMTLTIPITVFLTSIYFSDVVRDFSRSFAMDRSGDLIQSIEAFKESRGTYPSSLADLTPEFINEIPSPGVMGIDGYHYKLSEGNYNISFGQNVLLGFNFEVVTFDPTDNHKAEGELSRLHDAGRKHWKYYVFD
jgi:hypothetical protein